MNPASFEDLVTTLDTGYRPQGLILALLASLVIHTSVVLAFMQTQVLQPPQIPPSSLDLLLLTDSSPAAGPAEVQPSASAPAARPTEIPIQSDPDPAIETSAHLLAEPEPKPEITPPPKPKTQPKLKPTVKSTPKSKPKSQPKPKSKPKPKPRSKPKPKVKSKPKPKPKPTSVERSRTSSSTKTASKQTVPTTVATRKTQDGNKPSASPARYRGQGLHNPPPKYPRAARRRGQEGRVVLSVRVSSQGSADTVTIHSSSGHGILDRAAVKAVQRWRFIPAQRNGQAVAMTVRVPVTFKLE